MRPGIQVGSRFIILAQHDIGFGSVQQGLVHREGRVNGMRITDTGDRVGILKQVRNLPVGNLVIVAAAVPCRRIPVPVADIAPAGLLVAPDILCIGHLREREIGVVGILRDAHVTDV